MSKIEMLQAELVRLEGWIQAAGRSVWPASFVQEWADRADDIRLELNHLEDLEAEKEADEAATFSAAFDEEVDRYHAARSREFMAQEEKQLAFMRS